LTGAQVLLPIGAGAAGTIAGTPLLGAAAAGGTSAAVETARQAYEKWRGVRDEYDPTGIAIQGALGALPGAPLEKLGVRTFGSRVRARAAEGATLGAGGEAAHTKLAEGRWPTLDEWIQAGGIGAAFGSVGGALEHHAIRAREPGANVEAPPAA